MIAFDDVLEALDPSINWVFYDTDGEIICESTDDKEIINIYLDLWVGKISINEHGTLILTADDFKDGE